MRRFLVACASAMSQSWECMWKDSQWQALGIGIYEGYAVMRVGREVDPTP